MNTVADSSIAEQVRAAVGALHDPELYRPLSELDMVEDVVVRRGRAQVTVRLSTAGCPLAGSIERQVRSAAEAVPGVRAVAVTTRTMTAHQRTRLGERIAATHRPLTGGLGPGCRVYAVASGKGGVGKSSVTANLAVALARRGQRIGVLDADVWGHSVPQLFGVTRNPVVLGGLMLPVPAHGVRLMSVGFLVGEGEPVIWRGPMLHKALQQFLTDTHWGDLDVLLIDLPPGTGDVTLSLLELVPDAAMLAVTTPQRAAYEVATRAARMARQLGMPVAGVVENMSPARCPACGGAEAPFGAGGGALLAEAVGSTLLGQVPLDGALREAADRGVPVVLAEPRSPAGIELDRVAAALPRVRRGLAGRALPLTVV